MYLIVFLLFIFVFLFGFIVRESDIEELELVNTLGSSNNSDPISQRVLLEELLSQVLEVLSRELSSRNNSNLITLSADNNLVLEVTSSVINLDVFSEILLKSSDINDLALGVGSNFKSVLLGLLLGLLGLQYIC